MSLIILHTNDFHGTLTEAKADRLREMRGDSGVYFDTGDCIKAGNLAFPTRREAVWELLKRAGCDAGVIGNRETHILAAAFRAKLDGHAHPLLCANLRAKDGSRPLPGSLYLERNGLRIGLFGVMVPMVTTRMKTQAASAFLWDPPIEVAKGLAATMKPDCDILIALTHIGHRQDLLLAEAAPEIDVILGGHSHTVLTEPQRVGNAWICQGGSHGRFVGRYEWDLRSFRGELLPL